MIDHTIGKGCRSPQHERLGEVELMGNPRPQESADETQRDGDDEPALASAGERLADSATDGCDDDQNDEC